MTTTREARHLSGADLDKTVTATDEIDGRTVTGILDKIIHYGSSATLTILGAGESIYVGANDPVTITGTDTPPGLNLHRSVIDQDE